MTPEPVGTAAHRPAGVAHLVRGQGQGVAPCVGQQPGAEAQPVLGQGRMEVPGQANELPAVQERTGVQLRLIADDGYEGPLRPALRPPKSVPLGPAPRRRSRASTDGESEAALDSVMDQTPDSRTSPTGKPETHTRGSLN